MKMWRDRSDCMDKWRDGNDHMNTWRQVWIDINKLYQGDSNDFNAWWGGQWLY